MRCETLRLNADLTKGGKKPLEPSVRRQWRDCQILGFRLEWKHATSTIMLDSTR
jgi:hypothetical protein